MQTQTVLSPLVNVYQTQLEASRRFSDAIFSGTEKIDRIVIDAIHRIFNQQLNFAQAVTSIRDPQSAATSLQSSLLARNPEEAMNYQKEVMRVFAEVQNDIGKSLQEYIEQIGTQAATGAAAPLEAAQSQAQSNVTAFNPMTSMFSVWESAFKEVASLARKNMVVARSTMEGAASRTMDRASTYTAGTGHSADEAARATSGLSASGTIGAGADASDGDRKGAPGASGRRK